MFRIKGLKRAIAFAVTTAMMLSVAGCGNSTNQEVMQDVAEAETEVTEIENADLDEVAEKEAEEPEATEEPEEETLTYVEENGLEYTDKWGFQTKGYALNSMNHSDFVTVDVWFEISDITVDDAEEDGFKVVTVKQTITGYRWFDGREKKTDVLFPSVAVADSYTGLIIPGETTHYDEVLEEYGADIEWDGETWHISYVEEAEWDYENEWKPLSDGNFAGWCTVYDTLTITIPETYDGLVLVLPPIYLSKESVEPDEHILDYWGEDGEDSYLFNALAMEEENEEEAETSATATSTSTSSSKTDKAEATPTPTTTPKQEETKTQAQKETPKSAHTHSYNGTVTANPTCGNNGTKTFTCSCGDSYTESIPATGHQWETRTETVVHPSQGHMENTPIERNIFHCDDCGGDFDGLDAYMGHSCGGSGGGSFSWTTETTYESTWVVDVPETTEVITISTCSVCGATQ